MGFLVTEQQRAAVEAGGAANVPSTIMAILSANHARVLDWFRSMDTNFDGVNCHVLAVAATIDSRESAVSS